MQPLVMSPGTGERALRFVGDRFRFTLNFAGGQPWPQGWRAFLRTNLGRAAVLRQEIIQARAGTLRLPGASWRDLPMRPAGDAWTLDLPLTESGFFKSKAYAVDEQGRQHWPGGPDVGLSVHPDRYRTANTIYCAFTRMFGPTREAASTQGGELEKLFTTLDKDGYTVIPPSGKLRDLAQQLPHIVDTLGCRILHLLPVNPTPTTYARMGRFGSPYACRDLTAIDPALVEFDKRTTGIEQFCELTRATHAKGARVFLDLVTNHTGWGSKEQETRPEWFLRVEEGNFVSPGAWGVTWEDLVEFDHRVPALAPYLAEVFLTWCRRGVDGFRCDAGYKVPVEAWRYITARVHEEFPETVFLLEGLGGSWEATEALLTEGGMQWAYSELFQNYSGGEVAGYLKYCLRQSERVGVYVHYSETHDNDRLAKLGREWSLLRNQLCALASASGGFGFTCGVEWLAAEKIQVHQSRGLSWGSQANLLPELSALNRLLAEHPSFFDGAQVTRLNGDESPVCALSRVSAEGLDRVLVLVNLDTKHAQHFTLDQTLLGERSGPKIDLLTGTTMPWEPCAGGERAFALKPGQCVCLSPVAKPLGLSGEAYRHARARAAWAITAVCKVVPLEKMGDYSWPALAEMVEKDAGAFLAALSRLDRQTAQLNLVDALTRALSEKSFPQVVSWSLIDRRRITLVPPHHWVLVEEEYPFRATLRFAAAGVEQRAESIAAGGRQVVCFPPAQPRGDAELALERSAPDDQHISAGLRFLSPQPLLPPHLEWKAGAKAERPPGLVLLANGRGGMARMRIDLGSVQSKYDCVLGANLHPDVPVDRHVFIKRIRAWVVADGFIVALDGRNLVSFTPGPPAVWRFVASAGDGRAVEIHLTADMLDQQNTTVLRFSRPAHGAPFGHELPATAEVRLTVRVDIEDRNFHTETQRNQGAEVHFASHARPLKGGAGFEFAPAADRPLRVWSDRGHYHHEAEWCEDIAHPVEASRGQVACGSAFSPGWFDLPIPKDAAVTLTCTADLAEPAPEELGTFAERRQAANESVLQRAGLSADDVFGRRLALAAQAYVVRRGSGKTVIAGYPWFLDWGRDSLICARGLLAAGREEEVKDLLAVFGRFEDRGTLPNIIHGEDASNRDTSDAPLWYGVVCEELAARAGGNIYSTPVDKSGRTLADVLRAIAVGYRTGTPNGIRMDGASGLIWSPSHFTWMDTNYPAATPREGYPVEIQVLWARLLRQLARLGAKAEGESWEELANRVEASLHQLFWLEREGWLADLLAARPNSTAAEAARDPALRSNCLLAVSLGLVTGERAQHCVQAALRYLVVPGALRSLAPLPFSPSSPAKDIAGGQSGHPANLYVGRYEGDEDTRRKLAYHNGTAWTWTYPVFCEALARAWDFSPTSVTAARAHLGSLDRLLIEGCAGQIPEILDGDAPHEQRGCDAQAWGVTEAFRVWKLLSNAGK